MIESKYRGNEERLCYNFPETIFVNELTFFKKNVAGHLFGNVRVLTSFECMRGLFSLVPEMRQAKRVLHNCSC